MIIQARTALYVYKIVTAIEAGKLFIHLTSRCPECGETLSFFTTGDHAVTTYKLPVETDPTQAEHLAVIVGCEGYWCINPALVGIESKGWSSTEDQIAAVEAMEDTALYRTQATTTVHVASLDD